MPLGTGYRRQDCSLARALELVGERWTLLILRDCFLGVRRFSDLLAHLDVSRGVLADRLDSLVGHGLLRRTGTGHQEYELTDAALDLWPALYALLQWGERRTAPSAGPRRFYTHLDCGRLGGDARCETCGEQPGPGDVVLSPGPGADPTLRDDPVSRALRRPHRLLEPLRPA